MCSSRDNQVLNVSLIVYYLLDIQNRTGAYYICFHHQNIPHCNFPFQWLEKDRVCLTHAGGATVLSRAAIGPKVCHSSSIYSLTSSVLLSWCSLGGGRGMDLFYVSRRSFLSLLLTTCPWLTVHRQDWGEALLLTPPLAPFCLCLYEQLHSKK